MKVILFDVAKTLARQSFAFRNSGNDEDGNYVKIVNLLSRHCPVLESMFGKLNDAQKILQDMLERPVPYIPSQRVPIQHFE